MKVGVLTGGGDCPGLNAVIRAVTYVIPARYFVNTLQSLFLAGNIPVVLLVNVLFLIASAVMFIGLTWLKTKRRLD